MNNHLNEGFEKVLSKLNPKQLEAVNIIDGPVMVVAGPGTGKTQLLSARIGNILKNTDTNANNILCLTYTDAGVVAMRKRLLSMIGHEAYNVDIFTFHGFCNNIIRDNIECFGGFRDLQLASDLETINLLNEMIDEFPKDHLLKRFKGNIYYDNKNLKNLFNTMKQENWSVETIQIAFEKYEKQLYADPAYVYKTNRKDKETGGFKWQKGDIKTGDIKKKLDPCRKTLAAAKEFENYKNKLASLERFDYSDMILFVLEEFKNNPNLLLSYQELYQYILVDEYQDTNGAQNDLIFQLSSYWGTEANLFVVGDDDQAIYRFQGANMNNIVDFMDKYDPRIIVLDNNYRSNQNILDVATQLINNNVDRLVSKYPDLTKELIASSTETIDIDPVIVEYQNQYHENKSIADQIIALHKEGVPYSEMAVIYRKHANAEDLIKYLHFKGIPLNQKRKINAFDLPEVQRLVNILRYLHLEYSKPYSGEYLLFEILHYYYFGLKPKDIGLMTIHCSRLTDKQSDDIRWRDFINQEDQLRKIGVENPEQFVKIANLLESWEGDIANVTLQVLFEKVLTEADILNTILQSEDKTFRLQLVNAFFELIKKETSKNQHFGIKDLLLTVDTMMESDISLPINKIIYAKEGVNFMTAHGAKGLEFQYVFMTQCDNKNWLDKRSNRGFSLPETIVPISATSDIEDDRRLFYVAMTRAKNHLQISYTAQDAKEKNLEASRFIFEGTEGKKIEVINKNVSEEEIIHYTADMMRYSKGTSELIEHDLIDRVLENYTMSVTHLNKYLRCPLTFYFENILRIPMARTSSMGFGNAIHLALENYFNDLETNPTRALPPVSDLLDHFRYGMNKYRSHFSAKEFELASHHGPNILIGYYEQYHKDWNKPVKYITEYSINLTEYKGVPINGKIDNVVIYEDHFNVVDYKTGKPNPAKLKGPKSEDDNGGDYWRQLIFYKLLMNGDQRINKRMSKAILDYIEPEKEKYVRKEAEISDDDIAIVEKQLIETYQNIQDHKFEKGCGEEKCKWCNFVNSNFSWNENLEAFLDDAENQDLMEMPSEI